MKNTYTATQQKELFAKDCKLINLKYEYTGYIEQEKWAIVSELSEQELFEKYPDEVKKYIPFVLLSVEQGKAIQAYNRNEDKYRKRQNNNSDAFGYDDGTTENMHSEVSVPDFIEQQEMDDYYNRRAEEKMRLFVTAMASLTLEQIRTVNREDLREYIGTVDDDKLFRQINATLKKTFGLWVYKPEGRENIRCLCPKCLNDYIHNPDYIVRRPVIIKNSYR